MNVVLTFDMIASKKDLHSCNRGGFRIVSQGSKNQNAYVIGTARDAMSCNNEFTEMTDVNGYVLFLAILCPTFKSVFLEYESYFHEVTRYDVGLF